MRKLGIAVVSVAAALVVVPGSARAAKPTIEFVRIVPLEALRGMKETLKLTDEQVGKYKSLRDVYAGKVKDAVAQHAAKQKELVTLMKAETPDKAAIETKVKEIMATEQVQVSAAVEFYTNFAANLSKDQQPVFWAEAGKKFLKDEEAPKPAATPADKPAPTPEPPKAEPEKQ